MLDVQKERLRHMVANAILELWKKETGSLSPVIIEGTICITAGSGRTTVVQVANHFTGSIPEGGLLAEDNGPTFHTPKRKLMTMKPVHYSSPLVSPSLQPSYFSDFSPIVQSIQSPGFSIPSRINSQRPFFRKPLQSSASSELSMDISSVKEEESTDLEEGEPDVVTVPEENVEQNEENNGNNDVQNVLAPKTEPSVPGTGFYVQQEKQNMKQNNKASESIACDVKDSDKSNSKKEKHPDLDDSRVANASDALDLSSSRSKEDDLALSPPQNYTAQVRNVIRQRLLASRQNSAESPLVDTADDTDKDSQSPAAIKFSEFTGMSPLPPLTNLNLNSPSMIPLPYNAPMSTASSSSSAFTSLHDVNSSRSQRENQLTSPAEMISPGDGGRSATTSPFDQNGNNKETLYVNDKGETQKVYKCNFCSKTFLFKSKYYEHLPVHTNVRPFQCNMCSRTYKYKYDLRVHVRTHMGIPTKSTVCPFCSVKFDTNKMLRLHIQDYHRTNMSGDHSVNSSGESSTNSLEICEDAGTLK